MIPKQKIKTEATIIGIAGTRGKTMLTHVLFQLFKAAGVKAGYISSNGYGFDSEQYTNINIDNTSKKKLKQVLERAGELGLDFIFVEVTSSNLQKKLYDGINFDAGVVTNLRLDNIKNFKTLESYTANKNNFLYLLKDKATLFLDKDDRNSVEWINYIGPQIKKEIYLNWISGFDISNQKFFLDGMKFHINNFGEIIAPLIGVHSQKVVHFGVEVAKRYLDADYVRRSMSVVQSPPGRLHFARKQPFYVVVDQARNPDALESGLYYLSKTRPPGSKIITVIGTDAPGFQTKDKGKLSAKYSDIVLLAPQDPNTHNVFDLNSELHASAEEHRGVLLERLSSTDEYRMIDKHNLANRIRVILENQDVPFISFDANNYTSRLDAIHLAVSLAGDKDIVYIAGKGDEDSILFNNIEYEWSDYEAINLALQNAWVSAG